MKNIVKGIIYQPHVKKTDIYGEELDISNLVSYQHTPIHVAEKPKPYSPKALFQADSLSEFRIPPKIIGVASGNSSASTGLLKVYFFSYGLGFSATCIGVC